ncbi:MAG: hypothetical protein AAGA10_23205 [Bacteroidota bacterium]
MCYYITALLKPQKEANRFQQIIEKYGKHMSNANDGRYNVVLAPDEVYVYATGKYCDCATELGTLRKSKIKQVSDKEIAKLRKKDWSANKIKRYLEEKEKAYKRKLKVESSMNRYLIAKGKDPDGWISIAKDFFDVNPYAQIGLVKHWTTKKLNPEVLRKENRIDIACDKDLAGKLLKMEEDTCYMIRRSR